MPSFGWVYLLTVLLSLSASIALAQTGKDIYHKACATCHTPNADGDTVDYAPAIGKRISWEYRFRIGGGLEGLYRSSLKGMSGMPPRGGFDELSDEEVKAAVDYILEQSL